MSILESGAWKPAVKSAAKARIAIYGVGGSGKSLSALMIARGLVGDEGTIAVLDTEGGTASIYADRFDFSTIVMNAPFATTRFRDAVENATQAGFDCLIVDGISPFWDGPGGVLEIVDLAKKRGGGWADGTPAQQTMQQAISTCPIHIILTMRAKSDTVIEMVNGKATPRKVGMKYVQRDSIEYEVSWLFYADKDHSLTIDKQRGMDDLDGITIAPDTRAKPQPAESLGQRIRAWLSEGVAPKIVESAAPVVGAAVEDNPELHARESESVVDSTIDPVADQIKACSTMLKSIDDAPRAAIKAALQRLGLGGTLTVGKIAVQLVTMFGPEAAILDHVLVGLNERVQGLADPHAPIEGEIPASDDPEAAARFQSWLDEQDARRAEASDRIAAAS